MWQTLFSMLRVESKTEAAVEIYFSERMCATTALISASVILPL